MAAMMLGSASALGAQKSVALKAKGSAFTGKTVRMASVAAPRAVASGRVTLTVSAKEAEAPERLRLHNLSPLQGSRKKKQRLGRGYGGKGGGTCGFGMRGQNARSGPGVRPGFEGGQTPQYRRYPKLKGIAGGMSAGLPKHVTVSVKDISSALAASKLDASCEITIEVLGDGELSAGVTIKATAFSESAIQKIEAAGGTVSLVPKKQKWNRQVAKAKLDAEQALAKA